ncbi:CBY1-interacting BAR domain-containing protein 1 isoform X6 [Rattus norvegicus]
MPSGLPCPSLDRRGARRVATETPDRSGGAPGALSAPGGSGGVSCSRAPWRPGAALVGLPSRVPGGAKGKMLRRNLDDRDAQTKQLQDAVTNVEKHFGELCQIFAAYVRKTARLRDKADLLVNEINLYASTETPNLKQGLKDFADEFAKLQDYRQAEVERLEAKVVEPLKAYGTIVKMKRDDLKATLTARNREAKQLSQLERTRQRNPSDRHVISQVGNKLVCQEMDPESKPVYLFQLTDSFKRKQ